MDHITNIYKVTLNIGMKQVECPQAVLQMGKTYVQMRELLS